MRKYSELLPEYLNGPNVQKHAEIIEQQDQILEDKLNLLRLWNKLERPILIQREQTD